MSTQFNQATLDLLHANGWHPSRTVATDECLSFLEGLGYTVYPKVREFLGEFLGITIPFAYNGRSGNPSYLAFNPLISSAKYLAPSQRRGVFIQSSFAKAGLPDFPCLIGWTGTDMWDVVFMDAKGRMFLIDNMDSIYIDYIGQNHIEGIETLLYSDDRRRPTYIYKKLSPYNEDRLAQIFAHTTTILSCFHLNHPRTPYKHGYAVDRFFRAQGFQVYSLKSSDSEVDDFNNDVLYEDIQAIPLPIDILTYHHYHDSLAALELAQKCQAKVLFPSFSHELEDDIKKQIALADIEFIDSCDILYAYERLSAVKPAW